MITWTKNGEWGLNGMDIKDVPNNLYGAICKLHNYERLGLEPEEIEMLDELYLEKCKEVTALKEELKAYGAFDKTHFSDDYNRAVDEALEQIKSLLNEVEQLKEMELKG